mgnify:FL=1
MGFRNGAYATVWGVEPGKTDRYQQVRLSTSRKNKKTGQFEQDFSGFCRFIGNANEAAKKLKERDRIRILECDVTTSYNRETHTQYVNYAFFDFEPADNERGGGSSYSSHGSPRENPVESSDPSDDDLPF